MNNDKPCAISKDNKPLQILCVDFEALIITKSIQLLFFCSKLFQCLLVFPEFLLQN